MKNYYFVSWNHGNGIYCTNLATAESAADVYKAYAERGEVTVRPAEDREIESAKRLNHLSAGMMQFTVKCKSGR